MDGVIFAQMIEKELKKQGIPKGKFYEDVGITATAMWGWRNGAVPKKETVQAVADYLGISFSEAAPSDEDIALREMLRDREDLRILLRSARDVPVSSVYALISQLEKIKEENQ